MAELWTAAATADRAEITRVELRIEQILQYSPRQRGHELSEGLWRIIVDPLSVLYVIDDAVGVVIVESVRTIR